MQWQGHNRALAFPQVQEDIVKSLQLRNPLCLVSSFDRPNIHFSVRLLKDADDPVPLIAKALDAGRGEPPCAIIYTLKRESADLIAASLQCFGKHWRPLFHAECLKEIM